MRSLRAIRTVTMRELSGYAGSPVAYVFIVIFLVVIAGFTWMVSDYFDSQTANLYAFFYWHPWLYMLLVPAIGMRLWSEERRSGTLELLFTMPIAPWHAIVGKYLAGAIILLIALALTFPMWLTVEYLGDPDNGVILSSYIGSVLTACAFLAVSSVTSALTRNQVVSFVLSFSLCLLLNLAGYPPVTKFMQQGEPITLLGVGLLSYVVVWGLLTVVFGFLGKGLLGAGQRVGVWTIALILATLSAAGYLLLLRMSIPVAEGMELSMRTPAELIRVVAGLGVTPYYDDMIKGKVETRALIYFASLVSFCLFTTAVILQNRRST